jgi:hypothetical protein
MGLSYLAGMDSSSRCARPGCGQPAAALLRYDYASATVWLDLVVDDPRATTFAMCSAHADTLRVPVGWTCEDRRDTETPRLFRPPIAV